jgi:hypothetical protein
MSATVAPLTATVLGATDPGRAGVASGVNNALARVASLLAIAVIGLIVSWRFAGVLDARVSGARLDGAEQALVAQVRARPLTLASGPEPVARAAAAASISAFRYGIGAAGLLVAAGGAIALIGLSGGRAWHP